MPDKTDRLLKKMKTTSTEVVNGMVLPNLSGKHDAGKVERTPTSDFDIANKKYVDDNAGAMAALPEDQIFIGNASSVATAKAVTGDISILSTGVTSIASDVIVNADIKTTAAIAHSKLADVTSANILVGNASNVPTSVAVSGDVSLTNAGVTTVTDLTITSEAQGDLLYFDGTNWVRIAKGTADQVLTMNDAATAPNWEAAAGGGLTESAELTQTANSGASLNTNATALLGGEGFTLNDAGEKFFLITDIETKSATAATKQNYVFKADADPPTKIQLAAWSQVFTSNNGTDKEPCVSVPLRQGQIVWAGAAGGNWVYATTASEDKYFSYSVSETAPPMGREPSWTASTIGVYVKLYYRGYQ